MAEPTPYRRKDTHAQPGNEPTPATIAERKRALREKIKARAPDQCLVRKLWLIPNSLVTRLLDYQEAELIRSEAQAVRRLLDDALRVRGF